MRANSPYALIASAVVLAALLALLLLSERRESPAAPSLWLPELPAFMPEIASIRLVDPTGQEVLLSKDQGHWTARGYEPLRLELSALRRLFFRLTSAEITALKTADPARHDALALVNPIEDTPDLPAGAKGTLLELQGQEAALSLLFGNTLDQDRGQFVRKADAAQTALISEAFTPSLDPKAWLDKRLVRLPTRQLTSLHLRPGAEQNALHIGRPALNQPWTLNGAVVPADGTAQLALLLKGLDPLTWLDIAPLDPEIKWTPLAEFTLADGALLRIDVADIPGETDTAAFLDTNPWTRLSFVAAPVPAAHEKEAPQTDPSQEPTARLNWFQDPVVLSRWMMRLQPHMLRYFHGDAADFLEPNE